MQSLAALKAATRQALAYVSAQPGVAEAEVFAAANGNLTARLNYTSHIPSTGLEEPKSIESYGLGIRAVFQTPQGLKLGFGSEPNDLSLEGVRRALDKARLGAVRDPEFVSLPRPTAGGPRPSLTGKYHDPAIMRLSNAALVESGWRMVEQALEVFQSSEDLLNLVESRESLRDLGLILGGDVVMLQERMAIASTHMPKVQTDESTMVMSFATAMVESQAAKGSGWSVSRDLAGFTGDSAAQAARQAIRAMNGQRVPSGRYRVVLGPQALDEIMEWILMPGLHLSTFYAGASPFMGKLGRTVASDQLCIYDDGAAPDLAGSKAITDEGLPTGRTDLIKDGVLTGLLSDYYNTQRILRDAKGREKLGADPASAGQGIAPRNGFRPGNGGGRSFEATPGATATNLVIEGRRGYSQQELLRLVGDGIYIGRIWYTYPVNGISAGDFSGTVVGDSYIIKDGRMAAPLKPNTLRMNDNVLRVINSILGIGSQRRGTVRWSSDQITWAPEVAVADFQVEEISEYMERVY
ncbi:MAG TPA: metallopeptidase TldD-related protein [Dehalococcoidia bacterium]|nr:metallopeptidase TldD-related protein [Dehalococcoidia bacterium]